MRLGLFLLVVLSLGLVGSVGALPRAADGSSKAALEKEFAIRSDTTRSTHASGEGGVHAEGLILAGAVLTKGNAGTDNTTTNTHPPKLGEEPRAASLTEAVFEDTPDSGIPTGIPEPNTMILLGAGLLALAGIGRRFTRT